jgi:hypothetical protein
VASTDYIDITSNHLSVYCKFNGRYKVANTDYIDITSDHLSVYCKFNGRYNVTSTYILYKVVYIILHLRHLIPRVNKINKNTTHYKQFHNSIIDLVL